MSSMIAARKGAFILNQAFLRSLFCFGIFCAEVAAAQTEREASTCEASCFEKEKYHHRTQEEEEKPVLLSFSYPHGADISAAEPFQLHVGSYFEIAPQLVASAGTTCSVTPQLPAGFHLNASTCVIRGVPAQRTAGVQAFTVTASTSQTSKKSTQVSLGVAAGKIHTVVGSREAGNTQQTALPGLQQKLSDPHSLCAHRGKLYIGQDASIAELDLQTGQVKLLLGNPGPQGNEGDGKQKEFAQVGLITGMVVHEEELYFVDHSHHLVRKVGLPGSRAPGLVSRVAGTGNEGFSGDEGPAVSAELKYPFGLAIVNGGKLLIADTRNHCIRAVDFDTGVIATVVGTPTSAALSDDGVPALQAKLHRPRALLAIGQVVYVADSHNHRIRSIDFQQNPPKVATFAGGGTKSIDGASAGDWLLSYPTGLSLGLDGKMYVSCRDNSHTVAVIDLQQPHHPTSLVAGTGVMRDGADFIAATSSALSYPSAVAAVGEGTVYIAEHHCVRRVAVSVESEELAAGSEAADMQHAELKDKMPFLGAWSTLKSDGAFASPFCLPSGSAFFSPALPHDSTDFSFLLDLDGRDLPPCVLGVARASSITALVANLHPGGSLTTADFEGAGIMLTRLTSSRERAAIVQYAAGLTPAQASQASTEVRKLFLRDRITLTGSVSRKELGDGSCEYTLRDVLLNGMPAATPSFNSMTTPRVGADVAMHVFIAAWDPSSNQLKIVVDRPPLLESPK